ncbi:DUF4105 domain-containing protein [Thioclava sp.]|uniref:Lnb N-terminal periplasmic domain-containing protein n=1 Tax=Thioclava sp. TaxID=1933450 RepID=UPI003AA9480E
MARFKRFTRFFFHALFALLVIGGAAWSATALWLHLAGGVRIAALAVLALTALGAFVARYNRRRLGWLVLAAGALIVGGWYQTITPRDNRDWAAEVSRGVTAQVEGNRVTLSNIRDFDWHSKTDATQRWITKTYNLDQLASLEMITSVWDNPDIAHLLVSFGFDDGEHVVYSVEIRREEGEKFNEVGGFFRQFELVLIGATEQDIVRLRTDVRHEEVRLYPVNLTPKQRREMFMSYVSLAQRLEKKPEFYNTISANCTTAVYRLALSLKSDLPVNWRLVMSGRLPEYLDALGVLGGQGSVDERRTNALIMANAQGEHPGLSYSQAIRAR